MKKTTYLRPLIAGLSLAVLSTGALASGGKHNNSDGYQASSQHMSMKQHPKQRGNQQGMPLQPSSQMLTELNLSETQQQALDQAQAATAAMREGMKNNRQHMRSENQSNSASQGFDPRKMFEQQNQRMQARQEARQAIQGQWLAFWDSLDEKQQGQLQAAMTQETHGHKGQHRN